MVNLQILEAFLDSWRGVDEEPKGCWQMGWHRALLLCGDCETGTVDTNWHKREELSTSQVGSAGMKYMN